MSIVMPQMAETSHRRPSAVALRHVAFEDLGLLVLILDDAGFAVSYCDAPVADLGAPAIEEADLLIVLGGPMGVYEAGAYPFLTGEIKLLERRLRHDQPTLGIGPRQPAYGERARRPRVCRTGQGNRL